MATAAKNQISLPMPPSITFAWELIGPAKAKEYLEKNFDRNRFVRAGWKSALADAMAKGEFLPTHQGIAFDDEGHLIDGQHRLEAIVESGASCWLLVARNLPLETVLAMDLHAKRKPNDQIGMLDPTIRPTSRDVAIARMMKSGMEGGGQLQFSPELSLLSTAQVHHFLVEHWEAIRFSQSHIGEMGTAAAPIRAAVAKAFYHLDHPMLQRWMKVFGTALADSPKDHAAVNFRKWTMEPQNKLMVQGGRTARANLYALTAASILAFSKGHFGKALKPIDVDPWPLPE